jgi:hypothetical protein
MRPAARWLAGLAVAAASMAVMAAPTLTAANYVETADTIVDMFATSGLAVSTSLFGLRHDARPQHAIFTLPPASPRSKPFETPCPGGGSVSGSMLDGDGTGELSVQDRIVTVFNSCRIEGEVVSGRSDMRVTAHRDEGPVEVTELEFRFTDLGTDQLRWSGPATVVLRSHRTTGSEHYVVTYRDLAVRRSGRTHRWSFELELRRSPIGEQTAAFNGGMTVAGLPLHLSQDEAFAIGRDGAPRSGRLTAADPAGARIQVEAASRRYAYRYFAPLNRTERPDSTSRSRRAP